MYKFLFTLFIGLGIILIPQVTIAQSQPNSCDELKQQFVNANAGQLAEQFPQLCSEGAVYTKITNFLYGFIGIVAVIALIYGGYTYMLAGGNAAQATRGRQIIVYTIAGVVLVLMATAIVAIVTRFLMT